MLRRLPALVLLLFLICLHIFPIYANDLWMHLLLGRDTLASGVPRVEAYSYTASGQPFLYHEWLAGVLLYGLHGVAGADGLLLLQPLCALLAAWLAYRTARRLGADPPLAALLVAAGLTVASFRLFVRPHLLALPLLAAALFLLERYRRRGRWVDVAALTILQIVWANLHGSFPEGIALAALFGAGEAARRWTRPPAEPARAPLRGFLLLPPLLLAASMLNPYGWRLVQTVVAHPVDPLFRARIYEYFPPFGETFRDTRLFALYAGWLVLFGLSLLLGRKRLDPAHLLPAAAFLGLSLWMNRAIADFVVVSVPWMALALAPAAERPEPTRRRRQLAVSALLLAMTAATLAFGYRFDARAVRRFGLGIDPFTPVAGADYLARTGFRGNIFCSFPHGAYLAWRLAPGAKVVFDSRTIPYGTTLYQEYGRARAGLAGFREHAARYRVDAVHLAFRLDGDPELHEYLRSGGEWDLVHFDDDVVLYVRRGAGGPGADALRCASPVRFDAAGIAPEEGACWQEDCERLLARHPQTALPRYLLAAALGVQGRTHEALVETERLLGAHPSRAHVHRLRATLFEQIGDHDAAAAERVAADRLEPAAAEPLEPRLAR